VTEPGSGKGRFSPTASFPGSGLQFVHLINRGRSFPSTASTRPRARRRSSVERVSEIW